MTDYPHARIGILRINAWGNHVKEKRRGQAFKALKAIHGVEIRARSEFYGLSLPWLSHGTRVFATRAYWQISTTMTEYEYQFNRAVQSFLPLYPAWKQDNWPDDIDDRFSFSYTTYALPSTLAESDFRYLLGDREVDSIIERNTAEIEAALDAAMRQVYALAADDLANFVERLLLYHKGPAAEMERRLLDSHFDLIHKTADRLELFNLIDDPSVDRLAQNIHGVSDLYPPQEVRDYTATRDKVRQAASDIMVKLRKLADPAIPAQESDTA